MIHVVSVRVGTKYPPEYVERLHDMAGRHLSGIEDQVHWCLTDDPNALPDIVNPIPSNPDLPGWWQKVYLFSDAMPWAEGDRVLYLDLDVCVTGRLEEFAERGGIIRDWLWGGYNSSVMSWAHGEHREAWEDFDPAWMQRPGPLVELGALPLGQINGGDQEWLTVVGGWDAFPSDWCVSYRLHAQDWPPENSRVVCFHGDLKPHHVTDGWVPEVWKVNGFTALPVMKGCNTTVEHLLENIRANVQRDVPWFTGFRDREQAVAIVCGGPSMKDCLDDIKAQKRRGAKIVTVNNALAYLMANGIKPDVHVMLDARPENAAFVKDAPADVRYLVASQSHPSVFDALDGRDVVLWHNAFGNGEEIMEILKPWWDEGPDQRPCILVPGGGTVGLRTLWLCAFSGYRKVHVYGMDSCYAEGVHHAYPQALNDTDSTMRVTMGGRDYICAPWMARQAKEFAGTYDDLAARGVQIWVHGKGLIPDMARDKRARRVAA